jgi:predicted nucleic-acid-binding Zn-ribbon protein
MPQIDQTKPNTKKHGGNLTKLRKINLMRYGAFTKENCALTRLYAVLMALINV